MSRTAPAPSRSVHPRRWTALAVTLLLALAAAGTLPGGGGTAAAAPAAATVTWTDDFDGSGLDPRWQVVNAAPEHLAVSDGALRIAGQPGDTYQTTNTAKNIVMLDVPAGDFTATATLSAPVTKVYQGAGIIAWKDMDNYVRSGLTFVGGLSPSGIAIENDAETGGAFSAVKFTDRPGATGATLRLQRTGTTIATSVYDTATSSWLPAGSTTVSFDTTQVGLYALAAQDGTVLPAAFDSFTIEHEPGVDRVPATPFVLQATGDAPYLVTDGDAIALTADQPTASLRFVAEHLGDGALALTSEGSPVVLADGALTVGGSGDEASPLRITDAGGGKVVLRDAGDPTAYVTEGPDGHLVLGAEADAVRFLLSEVAEGGATLDIDGDGKGASISDSMFGIFYEDINYAADGGLYAELVRNRSFEFNSSDNGSFTGMTAWSALNRSGSGTTAAVVNDAGRLNEMNRNYLTPDRRGCRGRHPQRRLQQRLRGRRRQDVRRLGVGEVRHRAGPHPPGRGHRRHRRARDRHRRRRRHEHLEEVRRGADRHRHHRRRPVRRAGRCAVDGRARHGLADAAGHLGRPGQRPLGVPQGPGREGRRDEPGLPAVPGWLRHQRRHASRPTRRAATPTVAGPTSGRRPSARSRSAPPTGTSGATTSPTASATWSTSSSPRTSAPSRSRSSPSAPTAAAARASRRCTTRP